MTKEISQYLSMGCMRCRFGGTPRCKVNTWRAELQLLRQIVLPSGSVVGKKGQLKNRVLGKKVEFYHNQLSK